MIGGKLLSHFFSNLLMKRQISTEMGTVQGPHVQGPCVISLYEISSHPGSSTKSISMFSFYFVNRLTHCHVSTST